MYNYKVYEDDDVKMDFSLEGNEALMFIHFLVKTKASKSVIKKSREIFKRFREEAAKMGYDAIYAYTPSPKFARICGGKFNTIDEIDGKELIVWHQEC